MARRDDSAKQQQAEIPPEQVDTGARQPRQQPQNKAENMPPPAREPVQVITDWASI